MGDVDTAISDMARFISGYAVTLAALGVLTMAILEAAKKLFNLRQIFQRNALQAWLGQTASGRQAAERYTVTSKQRAPTEDLMPCEWRKAYAELMHLSTGLPQDDEVSTLNRKAFSRSVDFALFELELPQMMSQLQEAADAALNHPSSYPHWFAFITRGVRTDELRQWKDGVENLSGATELERKALGELYGRIRLLVRRQLDAFQTVTAFRWREWNQLYSWGLGFALMLVAQILASTASGKPLPAFPMMIGLSLLGGLLAPVAKDLVDALAKIKR